MEEIIIKLFGDGKDLTALQMVLRSIVIFIFCLVIIRISGRRSFGMRMPVDNVISILLGAILSRAVVGVSPFWPTIASAFCFALLHRICGLIGFYNKVFGGMIKGKEFILYEKGELNRANMKRCMVTEKDILEGIRINSNLNSFEKVEEIYMESNGQISVVKKETQ